MKKLIKDCKNKDERCNLFDLTGAKINNGIEELADKSVKSFWNWGEGQLESKPSILAIEMNDCLGSSQLACNEENLYFTYINWNKTVYNNKAIRFIFDWNIAEIGLTLNAKDNYRNPKIRPRTSSKSYKKLSLIGYGLGKRGTTWKGNRVKFTDEK